MVKQNKCKHDDYVVMMDIFVKQLMLLDAKIWKRCMLEGCRYGYEPVDKTPADKCIYCGEPRNGYFDEHGVNKEVSKSIQKYLKRYGRSIQKAQINFR